LAPAGKLTPRNALTLLKHRLPAAEVNMRVRLTCAG